MFDPDENTATGVLRGILATIGMGSVQKASPGHYQERAHFKECIIYQVYPASFCDSNGDGVGDIQGYHIEAGLLEKSWRRE